MHKDIVQAFFEGASQLQTAYSKIENLRRLGEELLSSRECAEIEECLDVVNSQLARSWIALDEMKKKAVPEQ